MNPRLLPAILAHLLLSSICSQANFITDPGFESGSTTGLWGGSVVVTTNQRSGTRCAELNQTDVTWGGGYERTITGLQPNTTYVFSGYAKTVGGSAIVGVKNHGFSQQSVTFDDTAYGLRQISFTTGASSTSATCFFWNNPGNASKVYLDDLSLVAADAPELPPYELIFSDEFNTDGPINLAKWKPEVGFKRNNEDQYYRAENLSQSGGNLVITAKRETFPNAQYDPASSDWRKNRQYANWTSGSIQTIDSFDFLYGKIVCRAKVSNLTGTWAAIWTVGGGEWPATGEIDIMENYGGKILANFATAASGRWTASWDSAYVNVSSFPAGWPDSYHVWELEWSPTEAVIRLDGTTINSFNPATKNNAGSYAYPDIAPFQNFGQLLWLNLAIGGDAGGSTTNLPNETTYLVDYIRVYQRKADLPKLSIQLNNATDLDLSFDSVCGRRYSILESTDLSTWTQLTNIRGNGQRLAHTDAGGIDAPKKFYKARFDNSPVIDALSPAP